MKIMIITGSHNKKSNSKNIADLIASKLQATKSINVNSLELATTEIPLWNEGVWEENNQEWAFLNKIHKTMQDCDAFVIVTPEWGGMVPPALKNLLLLSGYEQFGHKPVMLVAVSSGMGGTHPISELRISGYKNNHMCIIPDHIIIRNVEDFLNSNIATDAHKLLDERIDYTLNILVGYAKSLHLFRESFIPNNKFQYGM